MYELKKMERYLQVNLLGPGPRLMKKNLPGRGLTKIEKHWVRGPQIELASHTRPADRVYNIPDTKTDPIVFPLTESTPSND